MRGNHTSRGEHSSGSPVGDVTRCMREFGPCTSPSSNEGLIEASHSDHSVLGVAASQRVNGPTSRRTSNRANCGSPRSSDFQCSARSVSAARTFIAAKGWTLHEAHIYSEDGVSGALFSSRPEFQRMMTDAKAPRPEGGGTKVPGAVGNGTRSIGACTGVLTPPVAGARADVPT